MREKTEVSARVSGMESAESACGAGGKARTSAEHDCVVEGEEGVVYVTTDIEELRSVGSN